MTNHVARKKNIKTPSAKPKLDLYQEVTNKMLTLLEQGVAPWRCPWKKYGFARNAATGHIYTGINALWMNLTPHPIPYFMSFNQAKAKGGKIRKGSKSEIVFFYKTFYKDDHGKNIDQSQFESLQQQGQGVALPCLKYYRVFNIADIENIEIDIPQVPLHNHTPHQLSEQIINGYKDAPEFMTENADRAYYQPQTDKMNMPQIGQFETPENYYVILFHELIHSTGHAKRLNREGITKPTKFGDAVYSKEELIAEMGSAFLCAHASIDIPVVTENSAAYLDGWIKALKADKKIIFKAAAAAQRATDYILKTERV